MTEATIQPETRRLPLPGGVMTLDRPRIMGVLNVTPDSFSDGGRYDTEAAAVARGLAMAAEGADLIDVGGESSRPGADRVDADEQVRRTAGVVAALRAALDDAGHNTVAISIDTTRAAVAAAALDAGAAVVNDISAGREDPGLLPLAAQRGAAVVLMHMRGEPATMQRDPSYGDVAAEVAAFLEERLDAARAAGVPARAVLLDPGIGFGKTVEHNLRLLAALPDLVASAHAAGAAGVMLGASRKSFLAKLAGDPAGRVEPDPAGGTAATTAWGVAAGVAVFRVHDVALNAQSAQIARSVKEIQAR
ncbi:MAG: dihydropteroate synthase [Planctomycetota bacterium]